MEVLTLLRLVCANDLTRQALKLVKFKVSDDGGAITGKHEEEIVYGWHDQSRG